MTELLKYKGYQGTVEPDLESNILCGKVLFIKSLLVYEANTVLELKERFEQLIDWYLEDCKAEGVEPEKPCSGTFNIRISPEAHRQLQLFSVQDGISLNEEVKNILDIYIENRKSCNEYDPLVKQNSSVIVSIQPKSEEVECRYYTPEFTRVTDDAKEC